MVDNCYGEFVEYDEPSDYGADLVVGSLIKTREEELLHPVAILPVNKNMLKMRPYVYPLQVLEKKSVLLTE